LNFDVKARSTNRSEGQVKDTVLNRLYTQKSAISDSAAIKFAVLKYANKGNLYLETRINRNLNCLLI